MGFFQDLKEDLSQAVTELVPEEATGEVVIDEKQAENDLMEIEALLKGKEEKKEESIKEEQRKEEIRREDYRREEKKERKIDMNAIFNQPYTDEVSNITAGMVINGDITSQGSLELVGTVHGNINLSGKMSITGVIEGNSQAAEIYAENAKITGEVRSLGSVKVGQETVIIGNIYANSAVIAGAIKGDIDVHGPVVLDTTAIVMGNIKSKSVQINNGAVIEGMCSQCYAEVNPTSFFDEIKKAGRKK